MLSATGMSTRAIAPVVGVAHATAARDLTKSAVSNETPEESTTTPAATEPPTPVVGADQKTISNDLRATEEISSVAQTPTGHEAPAGSVPSG